MRLWQQKFVPTVRHCEINWEVFVIGSLRRNRKVYVHIVANRKCPRKVML